MQEQEEIPQERVIHNSQAVTNIAKNQKMNQEITIM